jgi:hypothetical protein
VSDASQVHLAGPTATVGAIRRQRCAWCGALLEECDLANIARPLEPGEDPEHPKPWEPASWEMGALVRVLGTSPRVGMVVEQERHPEHPDSFSIPPDSCMALEEAVTR